MQKGKVPKFALLSDDVCKKMGRPTVEVLRHPCEITATLSEKNSIFNELEPCEELYVYNKIMEFESTLDEYGNPRELPIIPKVTNWLILMTKLKTIIRGTKQRFNNAMYNLKKKINIDFDKTEELPITEDTEPLDEITEPLPVINDKKNSWELTEEQLKKFNEESNIKKDTIDKNIDRSENEIGDK